MSRSFSIIVAADEARGIGRAGDLPWKLPGDMAYYKRTTTAAPEGQQNAVIMGRKTFESIPPKFRPLKERFNIVVTRNTSFEVQGAARAGSLEQALALAGARGDTAKIFVIGGGELYREALMHPGCTEVLLTRVHARFDCDTQLPPFEHDFHKTHSDGPHKDGEVAYTFETYARRAAT